MDYKIILEDFIINRKIKGPKKWKNTPTEIFEIYFLILQNFDNGLGKLKKYLLFYYLKSKFLFNKIWNWVDKFIPKFFKFTNIWFFFLLYTMFFFLYTLIF